MELRRATHCRVLDGSSNGRTAGLSDSSVRLGALTDGEPESEPGCVWPTLGRRQTS